MDKLVCHLTDVSHGYGSDAARVQVLVKAQLSVFAGEVIALVGPSGSGKSTLLHIAGGLELPEAGSVRLSGHEITSMSDAERTALRGRDVGFVYQSHRLLPEFSALENVMLPLLLADMPTAQAAEQASALLRSVGLEYRLRHRPGTLSGGEQQRTAVARALIRQPALIIADEPTGNLDAASADTVFALFLDLARQQGAGVLLATHDPVRAASADRQLRMRQGAVENAA